jgi:hypothetical protein
MRCLPKMLSVIAAAAPPLVMIVCSWPGEDLCGPSFCPADSDCAGTGGTPVAAVASGFVGRARRLEKSGASVDVAAERVEVVSEGISVA